ncbi:hypothetical protein M5689_015832 [Euphorbia peplus]|nr:hypothetical protein M5689_015832 [Euphorbia peplus]
MPVCGSTGFPKPLQVIEGCLCLCCYAANSKNVEIYVRKKHGTDFTWSRLCSINKTIDLELRVVGYSKDGEKIHFLLGRQVYSYDLKTNQQVKIRNVVEGCWIFHCIQSLVRINFSERTRKRKRINYKEDEELTLST